MYHEHIPASLNILQKFSFSNCIIIHDIRYTLILFSTTGGCPKELISSSFLLRSLCTNSLCSKAEPDWFSLQGIHN